MFWFDSLIFRYINKVEKYTLLNDGEYYVGDLIGCEVYNRGILIGTFLLVVSGTQKILIPYVDAFVKNNKRIDVELIEGFYNEN